MFYKYLILIVLGWAGTLAAAGVRPYELDWAGRESDDHPALIDFEKLEGWSVECKDAVATFSRSQEQKIWGDYVGKIIYRGIGRAPEVKIKPPAPLKVPHDFDAVSLWVYGNNFLARDKTTPSVSIYLCFQDKAGRPFELRLINTRWEQWFLCQRRLSNEQIALVKAGGVVFCGFRISGGKNKDDRVLFFDSLCLFKESFKLLSFKPRAKRGVRIFAERDQGINIGAGTLPFPNREETIVPKSMSSAKPVIERKGQILMLHVPGGLTAEIPLDTCQWDELRLRRTESGEWIQPAIGGGLFFTGSDGKPIPPDEVQLLGVKIDENKAICSWRAGFAGNEAVVNISWWMQGQSLVADIAVEGGVVQEVRFGEIGGLENPRLATLPYYTYGARQRPAVVVTGSIAKPLFIAEHVDWTLSNASTPFAVNGIKKGFVAINGGVRYIKKTNGVRNDCYERFVFSLAPRFEAVLPEIPNPVSPWKHVTGRGIWRAHGASNRESDAAFWREMHRYGLRKLIVTDHETGWRDEHESFTFRTKTAPKKGGDEGQYNYARIMQDELGYVYGPYNNFTDFAPVNEFWSSDMIARLPDNQLQQAWARCYAPKPLRAVEYCEKLAPVIEKKFQFSTAYCDVHTAVTPWSRTDYDWRVPGAGTFAQTWYAYGEIMLLQKAAWDGPVYSEGNNHFSYCGLTDGNYAQDNLYNLRDKPWLVDFDLQKMHDLCCNFGVGNVGMFFGRKTSLGASKQEIRSSLDRFLAATMAFGHPGFLLRTGGIESTLRSYYMLQQIAERYTLSAVRSIKYFDGEKLVDTSTAVASGGYKRSQVAVEYKSGVNVIVNGSCIEDLNLKWRELQISLPPNGYMGWTDDGEVEVFSGVHDGHRVDYARTPKYIYIDGRGEFTRFDDAAASGVAICRFQQDGDYEIISVGNSECGFAINAKSAVALDKAGKSLGLALLRRSRGLIWVQPVAGAFSYQLKPGDLQTKREGLACSEKFVIPGQTLSVKGHKNMYEVKVPADAAVGERIWKEFEGQWIDFNVVPLCSIDAEITGNTLLLSITPNISEKRVLLQIGSQRFELSFSVGEKQSIEIPVKQKQQGVLQRFSIDIQAGKLSQKKDIIVTAEREYRNLLTLPPSWRSGMCLQQRGKEESLSVGTGAQAYSWSDMLCGGVAKESSVFTHPPYKKGEGYTFIEYSLLTLPQKPVAFRAFVGKGDGSDPGDGIAYRLVVEEVDGKETVVGKLHVFKHQWLPIEADLSKWSGQTINLKLITDIGGSSSGDWGGWAEMRLESVQKELIWMVLPEAEVYLKPSPHPLSGITLSDLRQAKSGVIRYQAIGLSGKDKTYGSFALLNKVEIGNMAPAGGDEKNNVWSKVVEVPLTAMALKSLEMHNIFEIFNPGQDCFKVRNFCLEIELDDGGKVATLINAGIHTQSGSWSYAEGACVAFGKNIRIHLWFSSEDWK